jgi:hypothetical protein
MNGDLRVNPGPLESRIAADNRLNQFRYRNSDSGRQLRKELFGGLVLAVMTELAPSGLAHSRRVDVAVFGPLVDNPALDLVRDQIKMLLQGRNLQ